MCTQGGTERDIYSGYSVYAHVFPDGKLYIGSTRQKPIFRWRRGHGYKNVEALWSAILEAGWDNMKHVILAGDLDRDTAMIMEKELIKKYRTQDPNYGYNFKDGGQSFDLHSDEFLNALRNRMIGNTYSAGRKMSESHKKALSMANTGHHRPSSFRGKHHTEEARRVMSQKAKERYKDPTYLEKLRLARPNISGEKNPMYGRKHSAETRRKISEKTKGKRMPPESRKRQIEKLSVPVYALDEFGKIVAEYSSIRIAAEAVGANRVNVGFCCRNTHRKCRGYYWRYKEDFDANRC